ncbi:uncharacterized protein LOC125959380 [Anopheles darlingi]|uniref:uncharacterized protein LOC125959380 n=1 Tax=Anopheles darlingi TaxID=43151 RepID=UPI0021003794|nr:uncharacterized protein LOC125959380 [Anopheles darlingi]
MESPSLDPGIQSDSIPGNTKYHLALIKFLQDVHHFSVIFNKTEGNLSQISTDYDLIGAGILQSLTQSPPVHIRIIHQSWSYSVSFIFRLTPEIGGIIRETGYLTRFTMEVWCAFGLILVLILVSLHLLKHCHDSLSRPTETTIHFLTDMIGMLAQQGTSQGCSRAPVRIVLYTVLLANYILYNYYIASIVGEMLSTRNMGPQSIEQLSRSPLLVVFNNDSYNRALVELAGASAINGNSIPIYTNVATAVPLLQYESFAFHCELNEALGDIANRFDAGEICELRTMDGLLTSLRMMSFVLPKDSMYTEQFRLT